MSAKLCSFADENFPNAINFEIFFTKKNKTRIRDYFEEREKPPIGCDPNGCKTNLFFGFFFDGTRNNYIISEKNISVKDVVVSIA